MTNTNTEIERVESLVTPIASDLGLDLYDVERRGGTVRITLDTQPGSDGGITLDTLALATRLISREFDHSDPVAGHYTLEVTSPGLERTLRTPAHFQRETGKTVSVRLRDPSVAERRISGQLVAADEHGFTLLSDSGTELVVPYVDVDKAKTVFEYGPKPKPGKGSSTKNTKSTESTKKAKHTVGDIAPSTIKEKQPS